MRNSNHRTRRRATATVCLVVLVSGVSAALTATPANAVVPPSPVYTQTADRGFADGGPARLTPVDATSLTVARDGSVLFYDSAAKQIRRVDASDKSISVVAGSGRTAAGGIDTSDPGADVDLPLVNQIWTDSAGDVFVSTCDETNCNFSSGVEELSAATDRWSVRNVNPNATWGVPYYAGYAVQPDGTLLAVDTKNDVVRSFAPSDSASGGGTVVAGIAQTPGSPDPAMPGPATQTAITPSGAIVAAADGSFDFAEGTHVDHVTAAGTLTRLPDPTVPAAQWGVSYLATDGTSVYESLTNGQQGEVAAQPVSGAAATVVLAPSTTTLNEITVVGTGTAATLLAASGEIEQWPADGSATAGDGRSYAGLETSADGSFQSPDGTPLDDAFISDVGSLAGAPDGSIAIATDTGVRSVSGLSANSTLGTIASGVVASELHYANDGSLYALVPDPLPHVIRIAPDGTRQTVLGGGAQAPAAGVTGPDVLAYELSFAVDPTSRQLYFTDNLDDTVWSVDPSTLTVEPLGQLPNATQFDAASLAVGTNHDVLANASLGHDPRPLTRITSNGDESAAGCVGGPITNIAVLPDGTLVGQNDGESHICGPDGTDHLLGSGGYIGPLTSDGRMLRSGDSRGGGLLAYTDPITAPTPVDVASASVATEPGGVAVTVTPPAVSGEQITIDGFPIAGHGTPVTTQFTTNGSGALVTEHFDNLLRVWPAPAGSSAPVWQFDVIAVEQPSPTGDGITDAPVVLTQKLAVDSTPPAAPGLALSNDGSSVRLTVTPPADTDLDRVVVCRSTAGAVTDPHGCDDIAEPVGPAESFSVDIDPIVTTYFTAFAVDDSGNVSSGTTLSRSAASLVSGTAASAVGYAPAPGGEEVLWNDGGSAGARYALGTTAPANPDAGLEPSNFYQIGADGQGVVLPLSAGAKATVSIFEWTDATQTAFRRQSFTFTQGTTSDAVSLSATSVVDPGHRPTVVANATRRSPFGGTTALPGEYLTLYQRPVGTSTWVAVGRGTSTTAAGAATFTVPVPAGATDYQVRRYLDTDPGVESSSPIVRTSVRQSVSASLPSRLRRGGTLTATGRVIPGRAAVVNLQRLVGRVWRTVATAHASATNGRYRLTYRPPSGRSTFRVATPATSTLLAGASGVYHVVVG